MNEPGFILKATLECKEITVDFWLANKPHIINLHHQVGVSCLIAQMKMSGTPVHIASLKQLVMNGALTCLEYFVSTYSPSPDAVFPSPKFSFMGTFKKLIATSSCYLGVAGFAALLRRGGPLVPHRKTLVYGHASPSKC